MSFQPLLPLGGYAGWRFLSDSLERQTTLFAQSEIQARDISYFRDNIGGIASADALVSDYRLLRVALGAYGLQEDLPNRAFIQKVLSESTTEEGAFANRLADKRYKAFSDAFGFGGLLPPRTLTPGFADKILAKFERQEFERAVGDQNEDLRLALNAQRELADLTTVSQTDTTAWLNILGNPPLRSVFETAFGLSNSIAGLDLDRQIAEFRTASERVLGTSEVQALEDPDLVETLIQNFTIRAQIANGPTALTPGAAALMLLRS